MPSMRPVLVLALLGSPAPAQSIQWTSSLAEALERGTKETKAIFVAINMDGERANDEMVRDVYRDQALVLLSQNTVNLFCSQETHGPGACTRVPGITCAAHRRLELEIRERYLHLAAGEPVAAPQHLFLAADGTLLSSAVYRLTKGELEWMWVEAIRKVSPGASVRPSDRARAPKAFAGGGRPPDARGEKTPTKEEVAAALSELKKTRRGARGGPGIEVIGLIARSPEPDARDFAETLLRSVPDQRKTGVIATIGRVSPREWWEVVAPYVAFRTTDVRRAAVLALERLAEPKSLPALAARVGREDDPDVAGRLLRAMAAVAPAHKTSTQTIVQQAKSQKDELVRAHAVIAAGMLEDRGSATTALRTALQDRAPKVRGACAYALAVRRDREFVPQLDFTIKGEQDEATLALLHAAKAAIETHAPLAPFARFLHEELGDEPARR